MNLTCIASRLLQPISSLSEIVCMLAKPLLWKDRGPHSLDLVHPRPPEAMLTRQKASEHQLRISMYTDVNISRKLSRYECEFYFPMYLYSLLPSIFQKWICNL